VWALVNHSGNFDARRDGGRLGEDTRQANGQGPRAYHQAPNQWAMS
jgi:hypothetical protein